MTPYEELCELGCFGEASLGLLQRLMGEECRRFPVLRPPSGWSRDAVEELSQEFFADRGRRVTAKIVAEAAEEASVGRLLRKTLQWWLTDQARKTDEGAVRVRVNKLLRGDDRFVQDGAGWCLAGTGGPVFAGDVAALVAAANAVPGVRAARGWELADRRPPLTDSGLLSSILQAVLEQAGAPVDAGTLAWVVTRRFAAVLGVPLSLDAPDRADAVEALAWSGPAPEAAMVAGEAELDAVALAVEVHAVLGEDERRIVHLLDDHAAVAKRLGLSRSQTYVVRRRLIETLHSMIGDHPDRAAVYAELRILCTAVGG